MSGKLILDTNIVIALFAGDHHVVLKLSETEDVFVPSIAIGELWYGVQKSGYREKNIERLNYFISSSLIVHVDQSVAENYGKIKNYLRKNGKPIPENDIWIAAIAKTHNLEVVTRDEHFSFVEGIVYTYW